MAPIKVVQIVAAVGGTRAEQFGIYEYLDDKGRVWTRTGEEWGLARLPEEPSDLPQAPTEAVSPEIQVDNPVAEEASPKIVAEGAGYPVED